MVPNLVFNHHRIFEKCYPGLEMKSGDLVRFEPPIYMHIKSFIDGGPPFQKLIGILIKYEPWEKIASVMYDGQILRIPSRLVEKAGKK